PPAHTPPLHASFVVHTLPSSQGAVLFVWTQPVAGLQVSSVHTFPSSQLGDAPPTHLPPLHLSLVVQAFPSLQGAVFFVWTQPVAGLQVSSVQTLPSSQLSAGPPTQPPLLQVSFVVQAFPSLQGAVLAVWTQPVLGLQVSSVQTLPSSQLGARPLTQTPPLHRSLSVQAFPSSHEAVLFGWPHRVVGVPLSSGQELPSLQPKARRMRVRSTPPSKNSDVSRMLFPSLSWVGQGGVTGALLTIAHPGSPAGERAQSAPVMIGVGLRCPAAFPPVHS